ncbi:MAG: tetratricopeptide repeat protein [Pseudomonadota bacterium]
MRFAFLAFSLSLAVGPLYAATFDSELLPSFETENLLDPSNDTLGSPGLRIPPQVLLHTANQSFLEATDLMEQGLEGQGDYVTILELAPQIIERVPDIARLNWMYALVLAATGELDKAETLLADTIADEAEEPSALRPLAEAMIAHRTGRTDDATRSIRTALEIAPDHAYAHNLLGLVQAQSGEFDAAMVSFGEATRLSPEGAVYWRNLGLAQFVRERITQAEQSLITANDLVPDDCTTLVSLAQVYEAAQRPADGVGAALQCLQIGSEDQRAITLLVRLHVAQNDFDAALEGVETYGEQLSNPAAVETELYLMMNQPQKALDLQKSGQEPNLQHAIASAMAGDIADGRALLQEVMANERLSLDAALADVAFSVAAGDPVSSDARTALSGDPVSRARLAWYDALALASTKGADAAVEMAMQADRMLTGVRFIGAPRSDWEALSDPELRARAATAMLWLLRGYDIPARDGFDEILSSADIQQARYFASLADVGLERASDALLRMQPVGRNAPDYYAANVLLGELYLNFGQMSDALASYQNASSVAVDGNVLMKIALISDHLDQPALAEIALRQFIDMFPQSFIGYNQLAWVFVQREIRLNEALSLAQKADALQPGNASTLDNIGWIHYLQGRKLEAQRVLREANRVSGASNPDILFHLAIVEADIGSRDDSLTLLNHLTDLLPSDHETVLKANELKQRLN